MGPEEKKNKPGQQAGSASRLLIGNDGLRGRGRSTNDGRMNDTLVTIIDGGNERVVFNDYVT